MKSKKAWIATAASGLIIFWGCSGLGRMDYFCSECATDRIALQLCLPKNRPVLTVYSLETPTTLTAIKRSVEPGRCGHAWVLASGKGGAFIRAEGSEARRSLLRESNAQGLIQSAARVDAPGTLEFIRWALRRDMEADRFRSLCVGPDSRPIDFDSEPSFRAWFEEVRAKTGPP